MAPKRLGREGWLLCPPQALGRRLVGPRVGVPGGPGSAKDTCLNVGSHDVTRDVEVDADKFALPTGKHSPWWVPQPQPLTLMLQASGERGVWEHSREKEENQRELLANTQESHRSASPELGRSRALWRQRNLENTFSNQFHLLLQ